MNKHSKLGKLLQRGRLSWVTSDLTLRPSAVIPTLWLLLPLVTGPAWAASNQGVEHPGSIHSDDNCSACHADKLTGKSVHSAMALPCTVCHLAQTQGDMTTLTLLMPKTKICFACHEETLSLPRHGPLAKGPCLECHDAHSSNRRMLLREATDTHLN